MNTQIDVSQIFGLVTDIYIILFLHLLLVKDGWRAIEQLQVLLKISEEKGLFSSSAVARAFNFALLNALTSDTQIIARSIRDPMLLENCMLYTFDNYNTLYINFTHLFLFIRCVLGSIFGTEPLHSLTSEIKNRIFLFFLFLLIPRPPLLHF